MKSNIFLSLLEELNVPHTDYYTVRAYEEHPYKYTFYGIKSLCERYGVKTEGVLFKDKDEISKLPTPFLADYASDYVLVKEISAERAVFEIYGTTSSVLLDDFKESWGGHALLFQPDKDSEEPDYAVHKHNDLTSKLEWVAMATCCICILGFCAIFRATPTWVEILSIVLTMFGGMFSIILLSQQLKVRNSFVESVCHAFKKSSCNNVLESKAAKVLGRYSWSEIGFSYFFVNFICLLLFAELTPTIAYVGVLALPYSLWSIWYQRHLSQWCPFCLLVQVVIILQFALYLIGGVYMQSFHLHLLYAICLLAAYIVTALALNKFLPLLTQSDELLQARWQYSHLKMNDKVFWSLLSSEKKYPSEESSVIFGNRESKLRVTIFSNPYCNPCAAMHKRLQKLVDAGECQIQYYFTSFKPEWNIINKYMIAVYQQLGAKKAWEVYTEWYDNGKYEEKKFFAAYNLDVKSEEVEKEFDRHEAWRENAGFNATPTLLVNGHKIPYGYVIEDIPYFA